MSTDTLNPFGAPAVPYGTPIAADDWRIAHVGPDPTYLAIRQTLEQGGAPAELLTGTMTRYYARLSTYGDSVFTEERPPFRAKRPVVCRLGPEIGPAFAASCIYAPVNYCRAADDGVRAAWNPDEPHVQRRGSHPLVTAGLVTDAWATETGVYGTLLLWGASVRADLFDLERAGQLAFAGLCAHFAAQYRVVKTPWNIISADVTSAVVNHLTCTSLPHRAGACVLRRLEPGEAVNRAEEYPLPPPGYLWPAGPLPGEPLATTSADHDDGAIGTTNIDTEAVTTNATRQGDQFITSSDSEQVASTTSIVTGSGGFVQVQARIAVRSSSSVAARLFLRKGTTTGGTQLDDSGADGIQPGATVTLFAIDDSPSGTQSYCIGVDRFGTGGTCTVNVEWLLVYSKR